MEKPYLSVLSFSGGRQSSGLLWMVLRGDIKVDKGRFIVLNANPGMENIYTYEYVSMMKQQCDKYGIYFKTVDGMNLYNDLINLSGSGKKRIDNPPYWTKSKDGKMGRLRQSCTGAYKVAPMDREIRRVLEEKFGISQKSKRLGNGIVEKWVGFSYSEIERIKPSPRKYSYFRYPLIEMKMNNEKVNQYFTDNNLPIPPRSVCNACFANGLNTFKEMYLNRKSDWEQAVKVDRSVRDWTQIGIHDEVYVSNTLIPLEILAENNFDVSKIRKDLENDYSCDSGYCFL